ncbi:MAG: DUF429 domain-containing protein, partial [Chloroflexaceae bacterium]|nr:DUF429 domain-containing protein [Chloroflexaceae bacterium]
ALRRVFGRYQAGAHPANRQRLTFDGEVRGEALVHALEQCGFRYTPALAAGDTTRQITEVYPHAAMVALFGLERTLKYKRKQQARAVWLSEWQRYQHYLRGLTHADPGCAGTQACLHSRLPRCGAVPPKPTKTKLMQCCVLTLPSTPSAGALLAAALLAIL